MPRRAATARPLAEAMEERILHSADLAPLLLPAGAVEAQALTNSGQSQATTGQEIAFIDSSVAGAELLRADLLAQAAAGRPITLLMIGAQDDGLAVISQALADQAHSGQAPLAAVHVFSHGSGGQLQLGATRLDAGSLLARAGEVAGWAEALNADADLLLYGCDLAASSAGQQLVQDLAALTGANVAASTNPTGAAALGGDWVLEQHTGPIDSPSLPSAALQADWSGVLGGDIAVNTTTAGNQTTAALIRGSQQALAMDASGNFVVVWTSATQDGSGLGVYARRFASDGTALSGEIAVNSTTADDQSEARVVSDAAGNFTVVWTSRSQDGGGDTVVWRRFGADGTPLSAEVQANTTTANDQHNPVIARNSATGDFVVAWEGKGGPDVDGIYFRRFSASGAALDSVERLANLVDDGQEVGPAVAMDTNGRVVVAFEVGNHLYFQRFDAAGNAAGSRAQVDNALSNSTGAAIAMDGAGNFTLVYREQGALAPGVWGRGYNADGSQRYTWFYAASGDASSPSIAMDAAGNFVLAYTKTGTDGTEVYAAKYKANGAANGAAFIVNQTTAGAQLYASVALRTRDDFAVAWSGATASDADGVAARSIAGAAPVITSNGGGATASTSVAENSSAVTTVAASDADAGMAPVYSIAGGADAALFSINANTGALAFVTAPNFEAPADADANNNYEVVVRASDELRSDSQALTVRVTDVNEFAPAITSQGGAASATLIVTENRRAVTTVQASDADASASLSYRIAGGADAAQFSIEAATGALSFINAPLRARPQDSGANNVYDVVVQVTDGQRTDSQSLSVLISQGGHAIVVNTAGDGVDGDTRSLAQLQANPGSDGVVSLREALLAANAGPNDSDYPDQIFFRIGSGGEQTIQPSTAWPTLTESVLIDGSSQEGANGSPVIVLSGSSAGAGADGLTLGAGSAGSTLQGLVVNRFGGHGITLLSNNNTVAGNFIGTNAAGTAAAANDGGGIYIGAAGNVIGGTTAADRNTISGNGVGVAPAIEIQGPSAVFNRVFGNYIGTNAAGTAALGNAGAGVLVQGGAGNNAIGNSLAGAGNVIAQSGTHGVDVQGPSLGNSVLGNSIYGNTQKGIAITSSAGPLANDGALNNALANAGMDSPVLSSALLAGSSLGLTGYVGSASGQALFAGTRVEVFVAQADASGFGEGRRYLGYLTTDNNGNFSGTLTVSGVAVGDTLTTTATDASGNTSEFGSNQNVALWVNAAPTIVSGGGGGTAATSLVENATSVTTLAAIDLDLPAQTLSYAVTGGADAALFQIDASTGMLRFVRAPDFEAPSDANADNVYVVTVSASDGQLSDSQTISVTITPVNDNAPVITSNGGGSTATVSVVENLSAGTAVTTVTATDADLPAGTLTYSIVGGADAGRFTIGASTGVLAFNAAPDFEAPADSDANNVYLITVQASDGSLASTQAISLSVTDLGGPITVSTTADGVDGNTSSVEALLANPGADGLISLREAITATNNTAGPDTIVLPAGTYTLTMAGTAEDNNANGDLDILGDLVITGAGSASTVISGNNAVSVMQIVGGAAQVSGVTIRDGSSTGGGAGIQVSSGASLDLRQSVVRNNATSVNSGGGIRNDGSLSLTDVEVRDNSAAASGGGIHHAGSALSLTRVTLAGNSANTGAGLYAAGSGTATLTNATVSGNTSAGAGGGLYFSSAAQLLNVTLANNSGSTGGGIYTNSAAAAISLRNVLLSANAGGDLTLAAGGITSLGNNLSSTSSPLLNQPSDLNGATANLAALADNGGYTRTHALQAGSAALGSGNSAAAPATDQRGSARYGFADIGAYELPFTNRAPVNTVPASKTVTEDTPGAITGLSVADADTGQGIAGYELASVSLSVAHGQLLVTPVGGAAVTVGSNRNASLSLAGSLADLNATLASLQYLGDANYAGSDKLVLTARDASGASDTATVTLNVMAVNDAPTLAAPLTDRSATEDLPFSFSMPASSFADVDVGDSLVYSATQASGAALPAWLQFNPSTRSFSGTPANADVGTLTVRVTAKDSAGASASDDFVVTVANVNDAPVLITALADQTATEDLPFSFSLPINSFADVDLGDTLRYSATQANGAALPAWLQFNPSSRSFSGTPANADVDTLTVRVTATDSAGASTSDDFALTVANVNDAPVLTTALADQAATEDLPFSFSLPINSFADVDLGDTMRYSATQANGAALPAWLQFNPAARNFSGTPANADVGTLTVRVTATDSAGASASDDFVLTVANVNDAPVLNAALADQAATEDLPFSFSVPANSFADVDLGDTLRYSATQTSGATLPAWLQFNPITRKFSGTPANADVGTITVRITATDSAGAGASDEYVLTVANTNDAPVLNTALADQASTEDRPFSFTVPANSFADADLVDTLGYSATQTSGAALPAWLQFNPSTRSFSGTPANADVGTMTVRVTATDSAGTSASDDFVLTVANTNDAPVQNASLTDQAATEDLPFSFTVPATSFSDVDLDDSLAYSATQASGAALPAWLQFNPSTRSFSGTPGNDDVRTMTVRLTATDIAGASASSDFVVTVANVNDAPVLNAALAGQAATEDLPFSFTVPATSFSDVDLGDSLAYSASQASGMALPAWLQFNPTTRNFSGTPGNDDVGTVTVRVTATDGAGAQASGNWVLTVANVNDPPRLLRPFENLDASEDSPFSFTVPAQAFADDDAGDSLRLSASLADGSALPGWLRFDATSRSLQGTPGNDDVGTLRLRITATDGSGASASGDWALTVHNTNDAPVLGANPGDLKVQVGQKLAFSLPEGSFADPDAGDHLSIGLGLADGSPLPAWLHFDAEMHQLSGTPVAGQEGALALVWRATDDQGASVQRPMALQVLPAPVATAVALAVPLALPDAASSSAPAANTETAADSAATASAPSEKLPAATAARSAAKTTTQGQATANEVLAQGTVVPSTMANPSSAPEFNAGIGLPGAPNAAVRPSIVSFSADLTATAMAWQKRGSEADADTGSALAALSWQPSAVATPALFSPLQGGEGWRQPMESLQEQAAQAQVARHETVVTQLALSSGLSLGYVVWLLRGGVLLSSLLSALPAWQLLDPLPVMAAAGAAGDGPDEPDEPELERLFDQAPGPRSGPAIARAGAALEPHA